MDKQRWSLKPLQELRFEVEKDSTATLRLLTGTAEIFGTELACDKSYEFRQCLLAAFTWHGCDIELSSSSQAYVASSTPVPEYLKKHAEIEELREKAAAQVEKAPDAPRNPPRVMIVGAADTGKTALCKMLLGWATRQGREPIFIDLDVSEGTMSIPAMVSAIPCDRPVDVQDSFAHMAPLVYYYGSADPQANIKLYQNQISEISKRVEQRIHAKANAGASGAIINTGGWIEDVGYDHLLWVIKEIKANVLMVLDNDRMYNKFVHSLAGRGVAIWKLPKSGGVVTRSANFRIQARQHRIRQYFYGTLHDMSPHQVVVPYAKIKIFCVGKGPSVPDSALPIGFAKRDDSLRLTELHPAADMVHSVVCVSHAQTSEDVLRYNIAGFLYVLHVDPAKAKITFLAPRPGPLPGKFLLMTDIKFVEY